MLEFHRQGEIGIILTKVPQSNIWNSMIWVSDFVNGMEFAVMTNSVDFAKSMEFAGMTNYVDFAKS